MVDQPPRRAADREVEDAHRLRRRDLGVLPQRPREVGHARVDALREDVRLEARRPQVAPDGEGLVADGVAVGEGGEELVDAPRGGLHSAGGRRSPQGEALERLLAPGLQLPPAPAAAARGCFRSCTSRLEARHLQDEVVQQVRVGGVELRLPREGRDHRASGSRTASAAGAAGAAPTPSARTAAAAAVDRLRVEGEVPAAGRLQDLASRSADLRSCGSSTGCSGCAGDLRAPRRR